MRDRLLGTTEVLSTSSTRSELRASADLGRRSLHPLLQQQRHLVPGDSNGLDDLFVRDRLTRHDRPGERRHRRHAERRLHVLRARCPATAASSPSRPLATTLLGPGGDTNGINDIYVRDRLINVTKRVSVAYNGAQATVGNSTLSVASIGFAISGDGQTVAFANPDREPPAARHRHQRQDGPLRPRRRRDRSARRRHSALRQQPADRHRPRGARHRHEHARKRSAPRPRSPSPAAWRRSCVRSRRVGTVACPGGSLNGDADVADTVVELWPGSGNAAEPRRRRDGGRHVAERRSPRSSTSSGQNNTILNGDGDRNDGVVEVHPATVGGVWTNTGQAADTLADVRPARRVLDARVRARRAGSLNPPDTDTTRPRAADLGHRGPAGNAHQHPARRRGVRLRPEPDRVPHQRGGAGRGPEQRRRHERRRARRSTTPAPTSLHDTHQPVTPCRCRVRPAHPVPRLRRAR